MVEVSARAVAARAVAARVVAARVVAAWAVARVVATKVVARAVAARAAASTGRSGSIFQLIGCRKMPPMQRCWYGSRNRTYMMPWSF